MATTTTEQEITMAKKVIQKMRDDKTKAEASMGEIKRNIEGYEAELREAGVDPDKVAEFIDNKETEISNKFNELKELLPESYRERLE